MSESNPLKGRWVALEDRAIFRISGPDRVRFLNGQVTNDVSGPLDREAVAACLCSIKGKVEALIWISAEGDSLLLDGELAQRDFLQARLERYLIADDCEISDETDNLLLVHHDLPEADTRGVISLRLNSPGRDLFLARGQTIPFEPGLEIESEEFAELSLLAGIPRSGEEISGNEFPAELGLDLWAVNFHKGCYLGQEIISRIQSVGRVRRLLRIIQTDEPVVRGEPIKNALGEKGFATRNSRRAKNFFYLAMGLFDLVTTHTGTPENEPVPSSRACRSNPN